MPNLSHNPTKNLKLPLDLEDEFITRDGLLKGPREAIHGPPTYITGAIHVIKLRRLWSKISDDLYPTARRPSILHTTAGKGVAEGLRKELNAWHAGIPDPVDRSSSQPLSVFASRAWFQLAYDHSILLFFRHFITSPVPQGEEEYVRTIFEECAHRSRDMCLTYRRLYQSSTIQFTWGSLHILFLGGLTYLYCLWRSHHVRYTIRRSEVINTCMACNTVLVIIAERWSQAVTYRDTFETLYEKTIDMICNDRPHQSSTRTNNPVHGSSNSRNAEPTVSQDWFSGLEDMTVPQDSEWFVEELLNGMRDFTQAEAPFDDIDAFNS
jgi:hypothetical protein